MNLEERILFLGPEDSPLKAWLEQCGEDVIQTSDKIDAEFVGKYKIRFLISYGYRHILKKDVLDQLQDRAINLHISFLPWNRGADPNLWSILEDTPRGVTIHYLDEGVDTGDIIAQKNVALNFTNDTLSTSYKKLQTEIQQLFKENWLQIKSGKCHRSKQVVPGSCHRAKDRQAVEHLLKNGWDTPISSLFKKMVSLNSGEVV